MQIISPHIFSMHTNAGEQVPSLWEKLPLFIRISKKMV